MTVARTCIKCGESKLADAFGQHGNQCKACKVRAAGQWRRDNPERSRASTRESQRRRLADPVVRAEVNARDAARRRAANPRMGRTTAATCSRCAESFEYIYKKRHRTVCDLCRAHDSDWANFRLTGAQAEKLRSVGRCQICGIKRPGGRFGEWHIDHDHLTGKVCGVLCSPCNTVLGLMGDRPDLLRNAALYLEANGRLGDFDSSTASVSG